MNHRSASRSKEEEDRNRDGYGNDDADDRRQPGEARRRNAGDRAAGNRQNDPCQQHHLKMHEREPELPRGPQDAKGRAADKIIERPKERARNLQPQRLGHLGPDEVLLAQELVARRDPPVRAAGFDVPMRLQFGIEFERTDLHIDRPDFQETLPGPLEDAVVALRALRVIALDIEHVTPPDQRCPSARCSFALRRRFTIAGASSPLRTQVPRLRSS